MIGNHKSRLCVCCGCCFSAAPHRLYNVGGATAARIVSCEDQNQIWINNKQNKVGILDRNGVLEIPLVKGDVIYSCLPIYSSGENAASHRALQPDYTASTELGTTASRYGGIDINIYS